jgi:hypothetical protein
MIVRQTNLKSQTVSTPRPILFMEKNPHTSKNTTFINFFYFKVYLLSLYLLVVTNEKSMNKKIIKKFSSKIILLDRNTRTTTTITSKFSFIVRLTAFHDKKCGWLNLAIS